ncbi:MAG: hypothetical protein KGJ62_13955 [Armatimonadetes bacterium]|nr:hypothetical protein [Armatimonadota bacterium]MDE2206811.1 hypothetical protein [Armatimonadota bacterium]
MTINHTWDTDGRETVLKNLNSSGMALAVCSRTHNHVGNPLSVLELDGARHAGGGPLRQRLSNHPTKAKSPEGGIPGASRALRQTAAAAYRSPGSRLDQSTGAQYAEGTRHHFMTANLQQCVSNMLTSPGNRLVENDSGALTSASYDVSDQQILVISPTGTTTNTWDANGNLLVANVAGALTTNTWDGENRLVVRQNPTGPPTTNLYSADGLRQITQTGSGYTRFLWDDQNVLIGQDAGGVMQAQYTNNPGIWGGLASRRRSGVSSFFGPDQQGSARILVSQAGMITDSYSYKAFGVELESGSGTVNPYRYEGLFGYYRDAADWMYVRARWLDAASGRWVGVDPMWPDEARYVYVGNSPGAHSDPSGEFVQLCYRPVSDIIPGNCRGGCYSHRFLVTSCSTFGWGTKGIMWGLPANLGGYPLGEMVCCPVSVTARQERCMCQNANSADKGYKMCGRTWGAAVTGRLPLTARPSSAAFYRKCTGRQNGNTCGTQIQ